MVNVPVNRKAMAHHLLTLRVFKGTLRCSALLSIGLEGVTDTKYSVKPSVYKRKRAANLEFAVGLARAVGAQLSSRYPSL